jgi:hypothetical protein
MFYIQDITENINDLNISTINKEVIFSVPIEKIDIDDVIQITSEFEVTNQYKYNVMIGSWIVLGNTPLAIAGILLCPSTAFNVTPDMHHGIVSKSRNYKFNSSYSGKYVNMVSWAASDNSSPKDILLIEKGHGHLDVVINK